MNTSFSLYDFSILLPGRISWTFFLQNQKVKLCTVNLTERKMEFKSCNEKQKWLFFLGLKLPLLIIVVDNSVNSDQK